MAESFNDTRPPRRRACSRTALAFLAPKLGYGLTAEVELRMIMQLNVTNKAALLPAMGQVDHGFAAVVNLAVEGYVFDLAIAVEDFDAVEFDAVAAHKKLEPRKPAILTADMDRIVIVDESDMTVAQPFPLVVTVDDGSRAQGRSVFLTPEFGERFAAEIRFGVVMQFDVSNGRGLRARAVDRSRHRRRRESSGQKAGLQPRHWRRKL